MAEKRSKADSRNTMIAQDCGALAGLDSNIGEIDRLAREGIARCDRLVASPLIIASERTALAKLRQQLVNANGCLAGARPVPKQIETALTCRERGVENFELE